jgi:uncharacterized tellurite resistance protein B-like protein
MIIWGSRGINSVVESGDFHCPQCSTTRTGRLTEVRRFFTLYFIPLIPLGSGGKFVECESCGGTFAEEAMSYDPEQDRQENQTQMLRVMVMAALADGHVDDVERAEINKQYTEIAGLPVTAEVLNNEIAMASSSGQDLNSYVAIFAHELSPHGKGMVVSLAYQTMLATGELQPGHRDQIEKLANTLEIPQDQYVELLKQISEPTDEQ